jgi:hypothetical protein
MSARIDSRYVVLRLIWFTVVVIVVLKACDVGCIGEAAELPSPGGKYVVRAELNDYCGGATVRYHSTLELIRAGWMFSLHWIPFSDYLHRAFFHPPTLVEFYGGAAFGICWESETSLLV